MGGSRKGNSSSDFSLSNMAVGEVYRRHQIHCVSVNTAFGVIQPFLSTTVQTAG